MDESNPSTHKYNSKNVLSFAQLGEIDFPRREWLWDEWLPLGTASLLGGPPGAGKSLLAQTLCMAASAGLLLFGKQTKLTSTLYLTCEDEKAELRRRAISIATSFGKSVTDFEDGYLISKVGQNATICDQKFAKTSNYRELDELMGDLKLQLVALDLIPDLWTGNEIVRQEVNRFVKGFLGSLAVKHNACIVGLHHPSVSGQASGEGRSGSTAWEGSVRSRLYLSGADSAGVRKLSLKKSNYSALTEIDLKWDQGALQLSERSYTDPTLKDGGRQALKGVAKTLRDALRANDGEMALSEISDLFAKSHQPRDAIEALQNRGLVRQADGMVILVDV